MPHRAATLVLTPSLGGDFFSDLLTGLAREVNDDGGKLVVVETLQEHAPRDEGGSPGDFSLRVAWDHVRAVVSVTTAVKAEYLEAASAAGLPAVLLSGTQHEGLDAPAARPDNREGTAAAVAHLIEHGHRRIGFVGTLAQRDIRERYEAYLETLAEHGLDADPADVYETDANGEVDGAVAARRLLDRAERPTALMFGTDRNAIGMVEALHRAGVEVPGDIAVASFDNTARGAFAAPPLTSVDPRFEAVGAVAGTLVSRRLKGDEPGAQTFVPGAARLAVRESCGCTAGQRRRIALRGDKDSLDTTSARDELQEVLERDLSRGDQELDADARAAIITTVGEASRLLRLGDSANVDHVDAFAASLVRLTSRPDTLRRFADAIADYARRDAESRTVGSDSTPVSARIAAALWRAQASAYVRQGEATEAAVAEQYTVDAGLLSTTGSDPRELRWLAGTHVRAAALGLWDRDAADGSLQIVGEYDAWGTDRGVVGTTVPTEQFPPASLIDSTNSAAREVCVVVPVSTRDNDWGLLALIAEIEPTTARETYQHWAALLSAALLSQQRQEEIRRSALFDSLTQLPNRQLFVQQLDKALARRQRDNTPFAVLFLDLDGFKLINDSLGHQMGDRVLQAVASAISGALRSIDTPARFGGDEFVVLLADTNADRAKLAAHRIQAALSEVRDFDGHEIVTRASIGIASSAVDYSSAEDVLRDADSAMYSAKMAEPGSVACFDEPMHDSALERATLARDVLRGMKGNQFEVHYQPIVNLESGRTDRFEALLRWNHPKRGMLSPADFLPAIEDTAFMVQLGHWVLEQVCTDLVEWNDDAVSVNVNISDKEFWSQDLMTHVLGVLKRHGIAPERITLEVTEAVLLRRPEMALRLMGKLHEAGLRLHIDDFGTGFSSLETLHRFPVDAFKIDRSFIQSLADAENSVELIASLVKLGKALGLSVVAEGVETDEQLDFLKGLGCATGQGFLFMPAVTRDRVTELLGRDIRKQQP